MNFQFSTKDSKKNTNSTKKRVSLLTAEKIRHKPKIFRESKYSIAKEFQRLNSA